MFFILFWQIFCKLHEKYRFFDAVSINDNYRKPALLTKLKNRKKTMIAFFLFLIFKDIFLSS